MLENKFEKYAKKYYQEKKYSQSLKSCFQCISINPLLEWPYEIAGFCYMKLKMYNQSRGCFLVALSLCEESKKENYNKLINHNEKISN